MGEEYLTLEQNTCAARIFLNTFCLILENTECVDEFSKIKIFDNNKNEVGILYFNNGKVYISAKYNESVLDANYDIAKMCGFVDYEDDNALFRDWFTDINYTIQKQDNVKISGNFNIACSADTKFGVKCVVHPLIKCEIPNYGNITLKILRDGNTFGLEIQSKNYKETIDIMPWDDINGFIKHVITKGEYDLAIGIHEYKKYCGIFSSKTNNEDKLYMFLKENNWDETINLKREFIEKVGNDYSTELLIQKGELMKKLDPNMYEVIKELYKILLIGDISLMDNLISVCYDDYTDKEIFALLDVKRKKMNYQDDYDNLVNAYFAIGKNSFFFPLEEHKKLYIK